MPYKTGIRLLGVARNPANGFPARLLGRHATERGAPLHDDQRLFKFLILEVVQAGLTYQDPRALGNSKNLGYRRRNQNMTYDKKVQIRVTEFIRNSKRPIRPTISQGSPFKDYCYLNDEQEKECTEFLYKEGMFITTASGEDPNQLLWDGIDHVILSLSIKGEEYLYRLKQPTVAWIKRNWFPAVVAAITTGSSIASITLNIVLKSTG